MNAMKTVDGTGRWHHGMTSTNNAIFVCGGGDQAVGAGVTALNSCEKFENGNWNDIQSLPTTLYRHCMVAINTNTILAIGGQGVNNVSKHNL